MATIKKTNEDEIRELDIMESEVGAERALFLERRGRESSCQNPASLWLWTKTIDGVKFAVTEEIALRFERMNG